MLESDLEKLKRPFTDDDARTYDDRFADALGVGLRPLRSLRDAIQADMDQTVHGIGWWEPFLDFKHRVLVSDHLVESVVSVETNLVEAKLHVLELHDWWERASAFRRKGEVSAEAPHFKHPVPTSPADWLPDRMVDLHIAGAARALASTLDCLAAVIIGVLPLSADILRADFTRTVGRLGASADAGQSESAAPDAKFAADFMQLLGRSGPAGWHRWLMTFRNMLVHRARRLCVSSVSAQAKVLDAEGNAVFRAESVRLLPAEPELSEIESWAQTRSSPFLLQEPALVTVPRLLGSTTKLISDASEALERIWERRRANPDLIPQPASQWKHGPRDRCNFAGYEPGSAPVRFELMNSSPVVVQRLRGAGLEPRHRSKWD